jgi:hypothetical protein
MKFHHLLPALLLVGCASSRPPTTDVSGGLLPQKHDTPDQSSVRTPEQLKAYPVGRYEDPDDPDVMHEGHTVYRAETSPDWNTDPNEPTSLPLGPGEMATADPAQEHTALTAELEQRLKQEDQLLQTTYEQNERLAEEIKALQAQQQHTLLPVPPAEPPVAASQPKPPTDAPSQPSPVTTVSTSKTWWQWLWSKPQIQNQKTIKP